MALEIYNNFKRGLLAGDYGLGGASPPATLALAASGYTPNVDTHLDFADVTNEHSGAGYSSPGTEIAGDAVTQDNTDDEGVFDGNDTVYTALEGAAVAGHVAHMNTGTAGTSLLIFYDDSGGYPITPNATDFTVTWAAEGIVNAS